MIKQLLSIMTLFISINTQAYDFNKATGYYSIDAEADCSGDDYPQSGSYEILISRPGLYTDMEITSKVIQEERYLHFNVHNGHRRMEVNVPLEGKDIKVKKNTLSKKDKGTRYISSCDLFGMDVPCFRKSKWDYSWSLTFNEDHAIYKWSHFKKSGTCKFTKKN